MKIGIVTLAFSLISAPAFAACFGTDTLSTCTDDSGNHYTVTRMGNTTMMEGSNARTGSRWSQDSYSIGNSTIHHGRDSDGNSWSTTCFNGICN
ncbi:hypothetical protein GOA57_05230 [Sinorhizobium meliloti]|nr:hypothetical protein [Sinorhizobium meliloti]